MAVVGIAVDRAGISRRRQAGLFGAPRTMYRLLAKSRRRRLFQAKRRLYAQFVDHGDACFDIGASVGDRCRVIRSLGGVVVAVEPRADAVAQIRREFRRDHRVRVVHSGVGAEVGTAQFHVPSSQGSLASCSSEFVDKMPRWDQFSHLTWDRQQTIPLTTLDDLVAEFGRPRFCKIDVEGFEDEVVRGLTHPIEIISLEYLREFVTPARSAVARLATLGSYRFNVSVEETMELLWPDWRDAAAVDDYLVRLAAGGTGAPTEGFGDVYARLPSDERSA